MKVSFDVHDDVVSELKAAGVNLEAEAKEAFLVEMYRRDKLTHHELELALGLTGDETNGVLKKYKVATGPTLEQHRASAAWLRETRAKP